MASERLRNLSPASRGSGRFQEPLLLGITNVVSGNPAVNSCRRVGDPLKNLNTRIGNRRTGGAAPNKRYREFGASMELSDGAIVC